MVIELLIRIIFPLLLLSLFVYAILLLLIGIIKYAGFLDKARRSGGDSFGIAMGAMKFLFGNDLTGEMTFLRLYKYSLVVTAGLVVLIGVNMVMSS
ncbi:hypothetical protein [Teredinibacter franksiae]|uniref:hypothetical protein n=1 Tax=Teredinibacter franksiae TaxID=2761453 RepID=UPI001623C953|nr:hypothetical protein [Teredinibacter franksiae]